MIMERLTLEDAISHAKEVAEKNYRGADFESIDSVDDDIKANCIKCAEEHEQLAEWLEELKSYKDLDEQGLLVRLPCKVGDSVFIIVGKDISRQGIRKIEISDNSIIFKTNRQKRIFNVAEFGKTVFLAREDAEKKLEEF
jgi:hypothetical protein|nr:MAG: hypothetical protein [Bacteriophage sp.]UWD75462.1 MAG: hypothetical protein [Bacteriophage sp.]